MTPARPSMAPSALSGAIEVLERACAAWTEAIDAILAFCSCREKFGVWPDGYDLSPPSPPGLKTRNWIQSRHIAFARGRASHG